MGREQLVGWIREYAREAGLDDDWVDHRVRQAEHEYAANRSYTQTYDEVATGARVAWRNSARCIGRLYWRSLVVRDRRDAASAREVFDACIDHLRCSTNDGRIRPTITLFPPANADGVGPRIWNEQLIRYAGYERADGTVVGDPRNVEFTRRCQALGWRGNGGRFDLLPLVIQFPGEPVRWFSIPRSVVMEVPILHPEHEWFADLSIRWHALPAISSMRLEAYGVSYTAAPFSGWYMGTEIGARNLSDTDRYDLLPRIAERLGLDTSDERTLWRDRCLVELNRAVLWSFNRAGVSIADHHTESQRFLMFLEAMTRSGQAVPTDWSWIVAPMSASTLPTFHRYYDNFETTPNFFSQPTVFEPRFGAADQRSTATDAQRRATTMQMAAGQCAGGHH
jgi:nitric-oxide synthase